MLIGLTGHAQHGKDTFADRARTHGFKRYALADGVRASAYALDPWIVVTMRERDVIMAASPTAFPVVGVQRLRPVIDTVGWDVAKVNIAEVRTLLQRLGTEAVRDVIGENAWIDALDRKIRADGTVDVVVSDVRFPNEADWIRERGGVIVRIRRPDFDNGLPADHPSEALVDSLPFNYAVANDGGSQFFARIDMLLDLLRNYEAWRAGA